MKDVLVFHGPGNFVTVTSALASNTDDPARRPWAKRRRELFGFQPDPTTPDYPFHPQSRNTLIALRESNADSLVKTGFIPCWINSTSQPEVHGNDSVGESVRRYMETIRRAAGFATRFAWDGDEVTFWRNAETR